MANRVVLDSNGLKVSKPGANVLTAPVSQLNFTSDFAVMGVFQTSEHTVVWPSSQGNFSQTISFGRTFPTPPFVSFDRRVGNAYYKFGDLSGFYYYYRQESTGTQGTRTMTVRATVTTTGISLYNYWAIGNPNSGRPPNFTFRWSAYEYNL